MPEALKRWLLVAVAQVPVAGVALAQWSNVQEHPVVAALLTAGWEVGAVALAFFSDVWAELRKDALQATVDWIRAAARGFAPGFRRDYNKWLIREYNLFNAQGLGLINKFRLSLEEVFVELRISPANPQRLNHDPLRDRELEGNRPVWDFIRVAISSASKGTPAVLAMIGPPGCGKTTLLQHVAVALAANQQRRFRVRAYTPILLFLRDHIATLTQSNPPSLGALVQEYIGRKQPCGSSPPEAWFEKQLRAGRCMVLLDGLDEVAKLEQRQAISRWVDAQVVEYAECPFLVTSRPQGYRSAPLRQADVLEVQPLGAKQVRQFIERWYLANEIKSSGNQFNADVQYRASKDARDLMERLQKTPSVNALTVNPLLLTMVAMVHRYHGALPGSRVELYKEICEVLLGRWRQAKGIQDDLKAGQKLVVLQPLAAYMMESERRDIDTEEAAQVIAAPLERVGAAGVTPKEFLEGLRDSSGLVQEREAGRWSFAHLTFQEYLAAVHWLEQKDVRCDWVPLVAKSWWREMLRLYAAQGDATELVRACLEVGSMEALTLAADCLEEAREMAKETRRAAEARIIADLESDAPTRQRLAAEVQLARRLKSLQRIDDKRAIDLTYLTCAEYQVFLDDMRSQGKYYQPDHWSGTRFAQGQGREPLCGVRAEDAIDFCMWLTQREGGGFRFRLPYPDEAGAHPAEDGRLGAWCHDWHRLLLDCPDGTRKREMMGVLGWQSMAENTLALSLVLARELTLDLDIALALDRARDLARGLTPSLTCACARVFVRTRIDDHAFVRARDRNPDLDLAVFSLRIFVLDRNRNRARNRDFVRNLDRDLIRLRGLIRDRDRDLELVRIYDRALNRDIDLNGMGFFELDKEMSSTLHQEVRTIMRSLQDPRASVAGVLDAVLNLLTAKTMLDFRRAHWVLLDRVLGYALEVEGAPLSLTERIKKWLGRKQVSTHADLQTLREGLRLIMAREAGEAEAWEGIRIVREVVQVQTGEEEAPQAHSAARSRAA